MEPRSIPITATIITLNEEANLERALRSVDWAQEVVVVDSGSTDRTLEIAKDHGAKVLQNKFENYGKQKNFAQHHASHDWVLNIDADEEVTPDLAREIEELVSNPSPEIKGARFPRKTFYLGRWIRHGGWYPDLIARVYDRNFARWTEPSVHETLQIKGRVETLSEPIHHFTFRGIEDQILTNLRYSQEGFEDLKRRGQKRSLWRLLVRPVGKFFECYFLKKGFLDGIPGFIIAVNAAHSLFLKYAYFYDEKSIDHRQ